MAINEASLIAHLKSDELIKCVDLLDWNQTVFLFLEYMDQGSMTDLVLKCN